MAAGHQPHQEESVLLPRELCHSVGQRGVPGHVSSVPRHADGVDDSNNREMIISMTCFITSQMRLLTACAHTDDNSDDDDHDDVMMMMMMMMMMMVVVMMVMVIGMMIMMLMDDDGSVAILTIKMLMAMTVFSVSEVCHYKFEGFIVVGYCCHHIEDYAVRLWI